MKRLLSLLLCLLLILPCAQAEETPSRLYHFTRLNEAPAALAAALTEALGAEISGLDGYASLRFDQWRYGQAVAKDSQGWVLCGLDYLEGGWQVTASHAALRQDTPPRLVPEAVKYGYSDEDIGGSDGCCSFEIQYDDLTYSWFAASDGWRLTAIHSGDTRIDVSGDTLRLIASDEPAQRDCAFNLLPATLDAFDAAAFSTDWSTLKAMSDASEYGDRSRALISYEKGGLSAEEIVNSTALLPMYEKSDGHTVIAHLFNDVEAEVLAESGSYVKLRVGDLVGWAKSSCVLRGSERASKWWARGGARAGLYGHNSIDGYLSFYASPNEPVQIVARDKVFAPCSLQAILADGKWFLAHSSDGTAGYLPMQAVCETDNFYCAYVYSSDPGKRLNLRSGPGSKYPSLGKYYSGVQVVNRPTSTAVKGWAPVFIEGVAGWVDTDYLCYWSDYLGREWLPPLGVVQDVNEKGLNLRDAPSKKGTVINAYPVGTRVEILGVADAWAHVRLANGSSGYMMLQYLGGEPKKAVNNSFKAQADASLFHYEYDEAKQGLSFVLAGTLPRGKAVRVIQRPVDVWYCDDDTDKMRCGIPNQLVFIQALDGTQYGYVQTPGFDFWK